MFEMYVRIQWNPVYNASHRIRSYVNETNCSYKFKRDLDAANLRPALWHGCGRQTLSASILIFRTNLLYVSNVEM